MSTNTRLAGHELQYEGAPHTEKGALIRQAIRWSIAGIGRAKCSCGALSDLLGSGAMRKAWHREHKDTLREETK